MEAWTETCATDGLGVFGERRLRDWFRVSRLAQRGMSANSWVGAIEKAEGIHLNLASDGQ